MKFKIGEKVTPIRLSPNLGGKGKIGEIYTLIFIGPKVRITPGTGLYFVNCCDKNGNRAAFNCRDIVKVKNDVG